MKKMMLVALLCVAIAAVSFGTALGASWYPATVNQAGSTSWSYYIVATDAAGATPTWSNITMFIDSTAADGGKGMLASALTAIASGTKVQLYLASAPYNFMTCYGLTVAP